MEILEKNKSFDLKVHAENCRNESGYMLESTGVYDIEIINIEKSWVDWFIYSELTGYNFYIVRHIFKPKLKNVKYYALCAGVGSGKPFLIGNGLSGFRPSADGVFYAFANDYPAKWAYDNNRGIVNIRITRRK